jgi:hypothetical protein
MIEILEIGKKFFEYEVSLPPLEGITLGMLILFFIMVHILNVSIRYTIKKVRTKSPKESETPIISDRDKDGYLR